MVTTIQIEESIKEKLDKLKIHHRETYNDLISRIIKSYSPGEMDKESLIETIDILSDPDAMRDIAKGLEDYQKGRFKTLAQVKKELN